MEKLTRFLSACIVIGLVVLGIAWFYENRIDSSNTSESDSSSVKSLPSETPYTLDDSILASKVETILDENSDLNIGISITDLQTGKKYHYGETASYTAASIGKLVSATAYLHLVEMGQASLDEKVGNYNGRTQLHKMIVESDNPAWEAINDKVTHAGLKSYAVSIGMTTYTPEDNIMSSDDTTLLLTKLASQKLLNTKNTNFLLSLMKQASMRSYIVAAVPDSAEVYHKVGYLKDRLHDASIIKQEDRSYVLVIFSKSSGSYDFARGSTIFGEITKATLSAFFKDQP